MISIVVPAFDEEKRVGPTLDEIVRFLDSRRIDAEVLVVDDGSRDRTSWVVGSREHPYVRVLTNPTNRGKGWSVRRGFLEARGDWVLFTDADLSTPIEELDALLDAAVEGADVVIGSRAIDRSRILIHQSRVREAAGIVFNRIVRIILRLPISDTQCGFKLFNREKCERVFRLQRIQRFGFDPELLYLARKAGLVIREIPVTWRNDDRTRVRLGRDAATMFMNLIQIRWNWISGKYRSLRR
jgi:glycosyltransferase involved in cell wall biosynthesis